MFQASLKLGEEWVLEPRETPDFLVRSGTRTFGLEVTECQIGERGRKGSQKRRTEGANQDWLDGVRADYEQQGGASIHLRYWGAATNEAGRALLHALLDVDFTGERGLVKLQPQSPGSRVLAFETPNTHWSMPEDRAGDVSHDGTYLQRVIDEKAVKLPAYREACPDIRLLVVADQIYNSGRLVLEPGFRPELCGFDTVYFFAYPQSVTPFYRTETG